MNSSQHIAQLMFMAGCSNSSLLKNKLKIALASQIMNCSLSRRAHTNAPVKKKPKHIDTSTDKNFLRYLDYRILLDVHSMDLWCSGCHGYYSTQFI
jgi:hypothetical protein